jgi:hypothetical protein
MKQRDALFIQFIENKGLYMFRALIAYPQEALHKRRLGYCVRVMSVGCTRIEVQLLYYNTRSAKY